jgi:hypothetical protein
LIVSIFVPRTSLLSSLEAEGSRQQKAGHYILPEQYYEIDGMQHKKIGKTKTNASL